MSEVQRFAHQFAALTKRASRILITITSDPDGDSLGSMLALAHAMNHFTKPYVLYSPDRIPAMFDYLRPHAIVSDLPDPVSDYPLIIISDTGDIQRTPLVKDFVGRDPQKTRIVNIDHHPTVTNWQGKSAVDHNFIDPSAASTTELLYKMFGHLNIQLTPTAATSLLTGLLTDTGHFSNPGTSLDSLDIAAELMARGAKHRLITHATMHNKPVGTLKLWGRALSRLKINPSTGVVSTVLTLRDFEECGADLRASTGISNFLNNLGDGKIALVLREQPGQMIKGSLRTTQPDVNVAEMASKYGGGGHAKAAGFSLRGKLVETRSGWRIDPPTLANSDEI